ncbi:MAG: ASKHA domain-containing protein [Cyclonatronaceae bacterium]
MATVTVHSGRTRTVIRVSPGSNLLDVLRSRNFRVYAPCGGEGTCGKCLVSVHDIGQPDRKQVTSCRYTVDRDIEVDLPDATEAGVLASQYKRLRELPPAPGPASSLSQNPIGAAIDLGTTTIAVHLADLKSGSLIETRTARNPQAVFGADVISRIHHCMVDEDGLDTLQSQVTGTFNRLVSEFADSHGLPAADIVKVTVAGNATMMHILLGKHPEPLAFTPFKPVFTGKKQVPAASLGLDIHPRAEVHILPSFSAYVGADVVAGLAALDPESNPENYLFVDVGTNGELALVTPDRILCCATAAGPAFEGANLACGMEAAAGAISRYRGPDDCQTIANAPPVGICGSGLVDIVASLLRRGVIREDGFLAEPAVIFPAERPGVESGSRPGRDILLTPGDVREVQLAKSAIAAGVALLLRHAGCRTDDIGAVYLAGGLGNYLQPRSAVEISLFPRELEGRIIPVGNTSASGALLALKSEQFGACLDEVLSRMELFELSGHPEFPDEFAANMDFPDAGKID